MDKVCFVILHYRDFASTKASVQSILKMDLQENVHIVIVDNDLHEPPEFRKRLQKKYKSLKNVNVLQIHEDGGFSYANNQGYRYAREVLGAKYIIVLNNDIEFTQKDFVHRLFLIQQERQCHILAPDIVRRGTEEHQNPMDVRVRTKKEAEFTIRMNRIGLRFYAVLYPVLYWNFKREEERKRSSMAGKKDYYASAQEGIVPFGACLIFMPLFVEREERAFDPETQFFYEEYILAYRCQTKEYQIVYEPALKVLHENGAATKKSYANEKQRLRFVMERTLAACEVYFGLLDHARG